MNDQKHELRVMSKRELVKLWKEYDNLCYGPNACFGVRDMVFLDMITEELDRRDEMVTPPNF